MKGHIRARGPGSWELKYDLGTDPDTGKRRVRYATVRGGRRDAQNKLHELLDQARRGDHPTATVSLTVGLHLEDWLRTAKHRVSGKTFERYQQIVRGHLIPDLGRIPLVKLTPAQIQASYSAALESGRRRKNPDGSVDVVGGLSARTVKHHHRVLSQALKWAVRVNRLTRNPAERADAPRPMRTEMKILDAAQTGALLKAIEGSWIYLPVLLAVTTGARRGELLAVRWGDVDFAAGSVSIAQTLEETDVGGLHFKAPKTERSRRTIALPTLAVEALREHAVRQKEQRLKAGPKYRNHDLVCCNSDGMPLSPRRVTKAFRLRCRELGLPIRFHDLRHSHLSHLLAAGVHPKVASERAGHSSVSITLDVYSHLMPGMQEEAASKIDTMLRTQLER